jgi:hypothetical protein
MTNHPNRSKLKKIQVEMMGRIWAHQKDDPRGAMRVYITGGESAHESILSELMKQGCVVECVIQLPRDAMPGVRLTDIGLAALGVK